MRVLLVDWLGRGGIAQCTEAWAHELRQHGHEVTLVCPPGRELMGRELARGLPEGRIMRHRALVELAADSALEMRPDVVVLNNYLIPLMEQRVLQAARSSGARVVAVVHNVRPHSAASASKAGLGRLLRGCDQLVVHSRHEAMRLDRRFGLTATCLPLPVQIGLVGPPEDLRPVAHDRRRLCQFGVMKRRYKHADLLHAIADRASSWDAVALGVGAREHPRIETVEGFLAAQELVEHLRTCSVALFPYRAATQSGGVVLAKALGLVPVATDVGALGEQISHGRSGLLVPPGTSPMRWAETLETLRDPGVRAEMGERALEEVREDHVHFRSEVQRLVMLDG